MLIHPEGYQCSKQLQAEDQLTSQILVSRFRTTKSNMVPDIPWESSLLVVRLIPLHPRQWISFSFSGWSSSTPLSSNKASSGDPAFPISLCCSCSFLPVHHCFSLLWLYNSVLLLGRIHWATLSTELQKAQCQSQYLLWKHANKLPSMNILLPTSCWKGQISEL